MIERGRAAQQVAPVQGAHAIQSPQVLHIRQGASLSYGAHQLWYSSFIGRMGGCGPTAASNLLWYLAATCPQSCGRLFDGDGTQRPDMQRLMNDVFAYIKPGMRGVDKASMLTDGAIRYGAGRGVALSARVLEIPAAQNRRPDMQRVYGFLAGAFADDLPIAFLNLSNGAVRNLDNWHWVTLVGVDEGLRAQMYDQGRRQAIDLALWLETTTGGGAFVALEPSPMEPS